ncbi:MAG TPA: transposase [Gammaproteobacteria bacterium]|nr:transposase [Gammaproteobacteria bacterium]
MLRFTCLPKQIANWLRVLRPMFRHRHYLVFCWFLVCQTVYQEKATVKGLARLMPRHIAEWHLRRLLTAAYWNWRVLRWWFADQVIATLPPPDDGVGYLVVDSTLKDKTGQKPPLAKKGRLNEYAPYIFGLHIVVVMLQWGNYRIPVDFEIVRRQGHPHYRSENRLLRWMLVRLQRPSWAEMVVVVADAAFASKANLQLIRQRGYFFVMAFARTWCFNNGQSLKALVTHLPKKHYRRCWVPLDEPGRRRTYWTYTKRARLRHIGDVTIILSKKRRHDGPKATKILVTNLPDVTARQVVDVYRRRWAVELLIKELKGATGLGQHQVTKDPQRVERSVAMSVMAYLVIVKFRAQDIPKQGSWSLFTRKQNFTWQLVQGQLERTAEQRLRKALQEREAA